MKEGAKKLSAFTEAPPGIQQAFWKRLGGEVNRRNEVEIGALEQGMTTGPWRGPAIRWDEDWEKRAQRQTGPQEASFQRQKDHLLEIPASLYVEALTGQEINRASKTNCPLHEERTPSFSVRGTRWHCFGCGRKGDIYDLAGALWSLAPQAQQFFEIHNRLREIYP